MAADAAALQAVGVRHAALRLGGASLAQSLGRIDRFGREVIASPVDVADLTDCNINLEKA
jgi:hypothetical protein